MFRVVSKQLMQKWLVQILYSFIENIFLIDLVTGIENEPDPVLNDNTVRFWFPELTQEGQWHHLVLIFHRAGIMKNSSISLFVDGDHVNTQKVREQFTQRGIQNTGLLEITWVGLLLSKHQNLVKRAPRLTYNMIMNRSSNYSPPMLHMVDENLNNNFIAWHQPSNLCL